MPIVSEVDPFNHPRYDGHKQCEGSEPIMMRERIFLIGFMGTGKTTIGTALASALRWELRDTDHEIVQREGRTIPEIFAAEGEGAFRQMETQMLAELSQKSRTVITTGGGAVLAEQNRALMRAAGLVVCLTATVDEIVRRVSADENRPLLQGDDLRTRVETLVKAREGLYDFAELTLDTTGREISAIVGDIASYLTAPSR